MSLEAFLLSPPIAGILLFLVIVGISKWLSHYSRHSVRELHETDSYACGQRGVRNYVSPDYSEFFPYAVLFTLVHAAVLLIATAPGGVTFLPSVFIFAIMVMLYLVFRKTNY